MGLDVVAPTAGSHGCQSSQLAHDVNLYAAEYIAPAATTAASAPTATRATATAN